MEADHYIAPGPIRSLPVSRRGRPRKYDEEIAFEICERIGNGEDLHDIVQGDERMPCAMTVIRWTRADKNFSEAFHCALVALAMLKCRECEEIAKDGSADYELNDSKDVPVLRVNKESLGRSILRIETIRTNLQKMLQRFVEPAPNPAAAPAPTQEPDAPPSLSLPKPDIMSLLDEVSLKGSAVAP